MTHDQSALHQQPIVSPDGQWRWDGAQWVPNPTTPDPMRALGTSDGTTAGGGAEVPATEKPKWFYQLIGLAFALLALGGGALVVSAGDSDSGGSTSAASGADAVGTTSKEEQFISVLSEKDPDWREIGTTEGAIQLASTTCRMFESDGVNATMDQLVQAAASNAVGFRVNLAFAAAEVYCPEHIPELMNR